jgi:hypothetical protein
MLIVVKKRNAAQGADSPHLPELARPRDNPVHTCPEETSEPRLLQMASFLAHETRDLRSEITRLPPKNLCFANVLT